MKVANASNSNTTVNNQVRIQDYYEKEWNVILRPPKRLVSGIVKVAEDICNNNNVGYSQAKRLTLYNEGRYMNFNFENITDVCYCDCSSFVGTIIKSLGANIDLSTFTTRTMREILNTIEFTSIDFCDVSQLRAGDILVKEGFHCIVILEDFEQKNEKISQKNDGKVIIQYGQVKLQNPKSYLNVRKEPSTNSQVIGTLDHQDKVKVLGTTKGWYKIEYRKEVGYCSKSYIVL